MNKIINIRFAPSPTGNLHLGNIRIALYSWLFSRKYKGNFLLRIEDTDINRSNIIYKNNIFNIMKWLNLKWDNKPIFQKDRLLIYDYYITKMLNDNTAYYCICNEDRINKLRINNIINKKKPKYDGLCRNKNITIKYLIKNNINYVVRFKSPLYGFTEFNDLIYGNIKINNEELDDFIIKRSNNIHTYNFCVSIDDHLMNITHIIRGNDHINNTPKQINILKSINKNIPIYIHIPLLLNNNKNKLSKKNNSININEYKKNGIFSLTLLNYLFNLDFNNNNNNILSLNDMIEIFNIKKINKSFKIIDNKKIYYINKKIIKNMNIYKLKKELFLFIKKYKQNKIKLLLNKNFDIYYFLKIYKYRSSSLLDFILLNNFIFKKKININFQNINIYYNNLNIIIYNIKKILNNINNIIWKIENIKNIINIKNINFNINMILRIILTETNKGPDIYSIIYLIGKEKFIKRLNIFIKIGERGFEPLTY